MYNIYNTNRIQEDVRLVRSDDLQNIQNNVNEYIRAGYELVDTKIFGDRFVAILIKYKSLPVKD